jgi:NAD(P)-dependent dehydrogenase (short-subunit alcohol dehydrogenase family)
MSVVSGKVAVVTGGNRGIGRGIAEALAREGATVALTARAAGAAEQAAKEIGRGAFGMACDVRSLEAVQRLFREVEKRAGGARHLVNNAGIGVFGRSPTWRPTTGAR